ncbi:hypothetical protein [Noviherbaspirillum aerium]|uniref:hypothetical protein n=1 Tax=Noviherbaspirillum aerium TaxID=2588497 RepID=UPI00124BF4D0|nr:hypothetical protein [Noviherbaspirillum aerium]
MRISWNASDPAPVPVGQFDEFPLFLEARRLFSRRTQELVWANTRRFADVIGPGHDAVNKAGWHTTSTSPFCFTASLHGQVVAAAWAMHIRAVEASEGCNLAYALLDHVEGRGLAKLLTAMAFDALFLENPQIEFVNVQSRDSNERASGLARSFGMREIPKKGFGAVRPDSGSMISYRTYRLDAPTFAAAAKVVIAQRLQPPDEAPGACGLARYPEST